MHKAAFDYHRPTSLSEALDLLDGNEGARPLAGGHSLLPVMKMRLAAPEALVDLGKVEGLSGIEQSGDAITIGAMTTHADIAASSVLAQHCPVLCSTAAIIGDPQVRNRGTIGGSCAHADPAADYPTVLQAIGASITVTGKPGERTLSADEFFVDIFTTALQPGELVTSVSVPAIGGGTGAAYESHRHPASGYAVVGAAVKLSVDGGTCSDVSVVVGGVTGTPATAQAAADALSGQAPTEENFASAAEHVAGVLGGAIGDVYASGEYRVHLGGVLTKRAMAAAAAAAGA